MTSNYLTGVTVLKELAVSLMAAIETDCVPGKQPPHQSGQRHPVMAWRDSEQKKGVVGNEHPCITGSLGFGQEFCKAI